MAANGQQAEEPLQPIDELLTAITAKDVPKITAMIAAGVPLNEVGTIKNYKGVTSVQVAIINNDKDILKLLLDAGASPTFHSENTLPPILIAAYRENFDLLELLVNAGADINTVDPEDGTPLHMFCQNFDNRHYGQSLEAKKTAFKTAIDAFAKLGADFMTRNEQGRTVFDELGLKIRKRYNDRESSFRAYGIQPNENTVENHMDSYKGRVMFIVGMPLDDTTIKFAEVLVKQAVITNDFEFLEAIQQKGMSLLPEGRPNTIPPLIITAVKHNNLKMAEYLLDHGYPVDEYDPESVKRHNNSYNHYKGQTTQVKERALTIAIQNGNIDMVRLLLSRGASVAYTPAENPLVLIDIMNQVIRRTDNPEMIEMLLDAGAPVNLAKYGAPIRSRSSYNLYKPHDFYNFYTTPLIGTIENYKFNCLQKLLEKGANPNQQVPYGTALGYALKTNNIRATEILMAFPGTNLLAPQMTDGMGGPFTLLEMIERGWLRGAAAEYARPLLQAALRKNTAARKIQSFVGRKTAKSHMLKRASRPPGTLANAPGYVWNNTGGEVFKLWERQYKSHTAGTRRRRRR